MFGGIIADIRVWNTKRLNDIDIGINDILGSIAYGTDVSYDYVYYISQENKKITGITHHWSLIEAVNIIVRDNVNTVNNICKNSIGILASQADYKNKLDRLGLNWINKFVESYFLHLLIMTS